MAGNLQLDGYIHARLFCGVTANKHRVQYKLEYKKLLSHVECAFRDASEGQIYEDPVRGSIYHMELFQF